MISFDMILTHKKLLGKVVNFYFSSNLGRVARYIYNPIAYFIYVQTCKYMYAYLAYVKVSCRIKLPVSSSIFVTLGDHIVRPIRLFLDTSLFMIPRLHIYEKTSFKNLKSKDVDLSINYDNL